MQNMLKVSRLWTKLCAMIVGKRWGELHCWHWKQVNTIFCHSCYYSSLGLSPRWKYPSRGTLGCFKSLLVAKKKMAEGFTVHQEFLSQCSPLQTGEREISLKMWEWMKLHETRKSFLNVFSVGYSSCPAWKKKKMEKSENWHYWYFCEEGVSLNSLQAPLCLQFALVCLHV